MKSRAQLHTTPVLNFISIKFQPSVQQLKTKSAQQLYSSIILPVLLMRQYVCYTETLFNTFYTVHPQNYLQF
jgi:hypothetical protein